MQERPNLASHIYEIQSSFPSNCGSIIHSRAMNKSLHSLFRHSCNTSKPNDQYSNFWKKVYS